MDAYELLWCSQRGNSKKKNSPRCFGKFTSAPDLSTTTLATDWNQLDRIILIDHPAEFRWVRVRLGVAVRPKDESRVSTK